MRTSTVIAVCLVAALPLTACGTERKDTSSASATASSATTGDGPERGVQPMGASAPTVGSGGAGRLEVTPTSVVYATKAMADKPTNGLFVIVSVKDRPTSSSAVAETAPAQRGGWQWVAADGRAVGAGDGNAANVFLSGFDASGPIPAGTAKWRARAFDISERQRGGTLVYTDGQGKTFRWEIPAQDTGPQVAELKKKLAG
ncbi:hypothetical protein [Streptomyces albireticuli]|uniref:Lipoprotein n=1 Tax=Streptomyces albireticuli TaxID=1940 RepID=A0A2A2DG83_9ACTN|nr:hypothetical protein [Streptomyces albireticuli]MCD9145759.1 hypothetical protein [Streptomyces albireticuli]MCD9165836.1 hypothetical protein [Streptomyces albireticuli]MCD9194485.1 hypothetical protein [Streptomyces albireticuli]PAU50282.1 hypothetical protein CK936_03350 [Streptomyces albireticuli]